MKIFIKIFIWVFVTIFMFTFLGNCLTFPNTITNIIGVFLLLLYIVITVQTRFFTRIKFNFKKKDKESV